MGRLARWTTVFGLLLGMAISVGADPASAHSNKSIVRLAVSADGDTTVVTAFLVYTNDHQPVRDELVLADAFGNGGSRSFQLRPDDRVPGYFASRVHLTAGRWTLRVATAAATVGSATGEFTVGSSGELTDIAFSSSFNPNTVPRGTGSRSESTARGPLLVVGAVFLVLLVALGVKIRATGRGAEEPRPGAQESALFP